jgi:hypothetical protein
MTIDETSKAREGRDLWIQYVYLNGYAREATDKGLKNLSRNLDLNIPYMRHRINLYLES